ncbi:MAG TPA: tetratricopeptide repeat protein, partial [Fimbriimonadaceae bacterium]|nr:tetratricopeptide repeat protein [Fimbriimonadaceae bacterium]
DMLMWFQLGSAGKIVQVPERLVHMLRRSVSTSSLDRRQFEVRVALYEREILPNLERWYAGVDATKLRRCRRLLEEKLGYAMALLATYCDRDGERAEARRLYRQAVKLAPKSKGAWYRYARSVCGFPLRPPV